MHAFDRQTDRQTDGRTDGQTDGQKSHRKTASAFQVTLPYCSVLQMLALFGMPL